MVWFARMWRVNLTVRREIHTEAAFNTAHFACILAQAADVALALCEVQVFSSGRVCPASCYQSRRGVPRTRAVHALVAATDNLREGSGPSRPPNAHYSYFRVSGSPRSE